MVASQQAKEFAEAEKLLGVLVKKNQDATSSCTAAKHRVQSKIDAEKAAKSALQLAKQALALAQEQLALEQAEQQAAAANQALVFAEVQRYEGHQEGVKAVGVSPDGGWMATGSWDKTAKWWDLATGENLVLPGDDKVQSMAVLQTGQLVVGYNNGSLKLWDGAGNLQHTAEASEQKRDVMVGVTAFTAESKFVSFSGDGLVKLWLVNPFHSFAQYKMRNTPPSCISMFPCGERFVIGVKEDLRNKVKVLDVSSGDVQHIGEGHRDTVQCVAVFPDGSRFVSGSSDKTVKLWSPTGTCEKTFTGHEHAVMSVAVFPDGQRVVSASRDKTIKVWDLEGNCVQTLDGHKSPVLSVTVAPDGNHIVSGALDGTAILWGV